LETHYYKEKLSALNLRRCYEVAPPRVKEYLSREIDHLIENINPGDSVLELGCGYGRIIAALARKARQVTGIDTSLSSLVLAKESFQQFSSVPSTDEPSRRKAIPGQSSEPRPSLLGMNAVKLAFRDDIFDVVICAQNGISSFHVDREHLITESLRVVKKGGKALFSSYSEKFWDHRLAWFQRQAEEGLLGEIDYTKTRNGYIECKDGFTASTVGADEFRVLTSQVEGCVTIVEIDDSSLFCEIVKG